MTPEQLNSMEHREEWEWAECKHCHGKGKVNICSYPCQNIWEEVRCGECLGTGRIQHPATEYLNSLEGI